MKNRNTIAALLFLIFALLFAAPAAPAAIARRSRDAQSFFAGKFHRTELYFGMNKKDGAAVTDAEWNEFLDAEVTPRFPEGFTILDGYGQFKDSAGSVVREQTRVLVLFYPKKQRAAVDSKIEELRAVYKKRFAQESVLRLDFRRSVAVSF